MKVFCLIVVMYFPLLLNSQPMETTSTNRKFSFGVMLSANTCYRLLNYTPSHDWLADKRNSEEVKAFGFSAGLALRLQLNDRIALASGLFYAARSYKTKTSDLQWQSDDDEFADRTWTKFEYRFIRIPVHILYSTGRSNRFYFVGGPSANFLINRNTKIYSSVNNRTTSRDDNQDLSFTPLQLSAGLGFGARYVLAEFILIEVEPLFNWFFSSVNHNDPNKEFLYSAELNIRLHYLFKKKSQERDL
jgi:hypothetical protein